MVKVMKVAAWKIGEEYIEDAKAAEQRVRQLVLEEMMDEQKAAGIGDFSFSSWMAKNWDEAEARVKKAMAGS